MPGTIKTTLQRGIAARIAGLAQAVSGDPVLLRRGRHLDTTCQLNIGDAVFLLRILDGRIVELRQGPFITPSSDFSISGDAGIWQRFLAAAPPPGDHDLFAFVKRKELVITGNLHPLMSHLLYFKGPPRFLSYLAPVLDEIHARR